MLKHLRVINFAILSDVSVELAEGFNALTGETGAGKSLIVEAVNLLRGGRASADIPRSGSKEAVVEAVFELTNLVREPIKTLLADAGLPENDDDLLVRRVIHRGGRSRTYINGALTTASQLAGIGALLVDLSGQHQHQGLVDPKRHRNILDSYADNGSQLSKMKTAYETLSTHQRALDALIANEQSRSEKLEYLRFQLEELTEANLTPGEDETLEKDHAVLKSVDKLQSTAVECESLLYGCDGSAVDKLQRAARTLETSIPLDSRLAACAQLVDEAQALAEEAARSIERYARTLDSDPNRLAEIDDRLAILRRLTRKHNRTLPELITKASELQQEIHDLAHHGEHCAELETKIASALAVAKKAAATLHKRRKRAANELENEVAPALAALGMTSAHLIVQIDADEPTGPEGTDRVEFLLSANRGEVAKPLSRVASGGELSRIMLALKLVLRRADSVSCYVFDEVDTGIGGGTAEIVAKQIREVANERQVLCVTHLPQIAAFADVHFHVSKIEKHGRTETEVNLLSDEQRHIEIARMVGGLKVSEQAKAHAREMIKSARA